jgi:hypothetical protein
MPSVRRNGTMLFYEDAKGSSLARFGRLVDDCFGAGSRRSPAPAKDCVCEGFRMPALTRRLGPG